MSEDDKDKGKVLSFKPKKEYETAKDLMSLEEWLFAHDGQDIKVVVGYGNRGENICTLGLLNEGDMEMYVVGVFRYEPLQ